jgi:predicted nucleotidyltransferase
LVLSRDDIVDLMRVFLPGGTNEARLIDQVDATISKVVDLGFLRRLKPASASGPSARQDKGHCEVRRILKLHADGLEVRAFGSRVRGEAKPHSDLDLAVMTQAPLPMKIKVQLEHALTESGLPFRVDVLYWDEVSDAFRRLIDEAWELIQEGARQER